MSDILCMGELMWDLHVEAGASLETGPLLRRVPGGASANTAMMLVELGVPTSLAGNLGDDALGRGLSQVLSEEYGIDCSAIAFVPGRTGLVFLERNAVEHERFVSYRPRLLWQKPLLPSGWNGNVLHISALNPVEEQLEDYLALAFQHRGWFVVDVNARPRAYRRSKLPIGALQALLQRVHVLKLSDGDRKVFEQLGLSLDGLLSMLSPSAVCVHTHAGNPTELFQNGVRLCEFPVPQVELKRSIGAGDAFCAGLLAHLGAHPPRTLTSLSESAALAFWQKAVDLAHDVAARQVSRVD